MEQKAKIILSECLSFKLKIKNEENKTTKQQKKQKKGKKQKILIRFNPF